jgi:hypothetical protein
MTSWFDPDIRPNLVAIRALGRMRATSAIPLLVQLVQLGGAVGMEAARALGRMNAHSAVPALTEALQHIKSGMNLVSPSWLIDLENMEVQQELALSLYKLRQPVRPFPSYPDFCSDPFLFLPSHFDLDRRWGGISFPAPPHFPVPPPSFQGKAEHSLFPPSGRFYHHIGPEYNRFPVSCLPLRIRNLSWPDVRVQKEAAEDLKIIAEILVEEVTRLHQEVQREQADTCGSAQRLEGIGRYVKSASDALEQFRCVDTCQRAMKEMRQATIEESLRGMRCVQVALSQESLAKWCTEWEDILF